MKIFFINIIMHARVCCVSFNFWGLMTFKISFFLFFLSLVFPTRTAKIIFQSLKFIYFWLIHITTYLLGRVHFMSVVWSRYLFFFSKDLFVCSVGVGYFKFNFEKMPQIKQNVLLPVRFGCFHSHFYQSELAIGQTGSLPVLLRWSRIFIRKKEEEAVTLGRAKKKNWLAKIRIVIKGISTHTHTH